MFELERELPGRMIIPFGTTKTRKGEIHVVPAVATTATGTLASLGFVLGQLLLRPHMLFAPSGFADREADRLAVADEDGRLLASDRLNPERIRRGRNTVKGGFQPVDRGRSALGFDQPRTLHGDQARPGCWLALANLRSEEHTSEL